MVEKKLEETKQIKRYSSNKFFGIILLITLITGYFYLSRDYTPKKILLRNENIEVNIENKVYIYYPEEDKLLNEEIIVTGNFESNKIVGDTIKHIVLKLKELNKIPKLNFKTEIEYFILKDKVYIDIPEKMFEKVNSPREELLLIYSFVNSLTNIKGIERVRFLIDNVDVEKIKYSNLMKDYTYKMNI